MTFGEQPTDEARAHEARAEECDVHATLQE
jgi:hypothetical protein